MLKIVIKYGGSNLRSPRGITQLVQIIQSYNIPVVVVVSALSGVTDFIDETIKNIKDKESFSKRLLELKSWHFSFLEVHVQDTEEVNGIKRKLEDRFEELEHLFLGLYYLKSLPEGLYDQILSFGEKLSSQLITEILLSFDIQCREALPEEIGLITSGEFGAASVDFEASERQVSAFLDENINFVIPGFYGINRKKQVTLFGRGGTDYSAAAIANCVNARSLNIWKDVSGFMSADPRFIKDARNLSGLTYKEAAELAYFGAKILHPRTVEPLMKKNIPVFLFNSEDEKNLLKPVTTINGQKQVFQKAVKSITFSDQFAILNLSGPGVGIKPGILANITTALNNDGINISSVITSHISINILLTLKDIENAEKLCNSLNLPFVSEISVLKTISLLALVGHGMTEKCGIASRVFLVLANHGINVYLSSMGASDVTTYLIIDQDKRQEAIEALHQEFFNN
jgi:aspartate kinase/aspartokinase/homoserine dehydrogenase 1